MKKFKLLFVLESEGAEPWRIISDNEQDLKSYLASEGYNVGNIVDGKIALKHKSHTEWAVVDIANVYWIEYV
jgi:hypothetical protein